jgi:poly-gamma-glutamate synthesis protein (capsule biosynthesis protein)
LEVSEAEAEEALAGAAPVAAGSMRKEILYIIASLGFSIAIEAQESKNQLKLIFAGDIMGHDTQIESAKTPYGYNFDTCFSILKPIIEKADIAIANLEVTLAGPPFKGYPQFSSPDELAAAASNAGFDIFITANNHSLDRRKQGLERTIRILDSMEIIRTGTFKNQEEKDLNYPLIIEKNNIRLALLNYTYGTNGLKVESPNIVNYIDREQIAKDLTKAELAEPDFTIVTIHWGLEYQREENEEQQELARFMVEAGADAVIGSHPHVVQPVKTIHNKETEALVVYSLGNFISNQRKRYTDGGILFEMTLTKDGETTVTDYNYLPVWVYKPLRRDGGNYFVLLPSHHERSWYKNFLLPEPEYEKMKLFNDDTVDHLKDLQIMDWNNCP